MLRIFKSRMLRIIYGPINGIDKWRTRYSNDFYVLYDELDIVEVKQSRYRPRVDQRVPGS